MNVSHFTKREVIVYKSIYSSKIKLDSSEGVGKILRPFCRLKCDTYILLLAIIMIAQEIRNKKQEFIEVPFIGHIMCA